MSRADIVITVAGAMSAALCQEFDDFEVSVGRSLTRLRVPCADPAILNGLIRRIESLGLELLEIRREHE
jgi:hypothetical protein